MHTRRRRPSCEGFTLVELLVVIAIIGILAGMILGMSGYASRKSDRSRAIADIERIKMALEEFRVDRGRYITNSGPATNFHDGTMSFTDFTNRYGTGLRFLDPWGRSYQYSSGTKFTYRLWSEGPSSIDAGDDIESQKSEY